MIEDVSFSGTPEEVAASIMINGPWSGQVSLSFPPSYIMYMYIYIYIYIYMYIYMKAKAITWP